MFELNDFLKCVSSIFIWYDCSKVSIAITMVIQIR